MQRLFVLSSLLFVAVSCSEQYHNVVAGHELAKSVQTKTNSSTTTTHWCSSNSKCTLHISVHINTTYVVLNGSTSAPETFQRALAGWHNLVLATNFGSRLRLSHPFVLTFLRNVRASDSSSTSGSSGSAAGSSNGGTADSSSSSSDSGADGEQILTAPTLLVIFSDLASIRLSPGHRRILYVACDVADDLGDVVQWRFLAYRKFLHLTGHTGPVFAVDFRDTVFLGSPFTVYQDKLPPPDWVQVFWENLKIEDDPADFNPVWVRECWGELTLKAIKGLYVVNAGAIMGSGPAMIKLFDAINDKFLTSGCNDQGILIGLVYSDALARRGLAVKHSSPDTSHVLVSPMDCASGLCRVEGCQVLNCNGSPFRALHQWGMVGALMDMVRRCFPRANITLAYE